MRFVVILGFGGALLLVLATLFSYLMLPGLIESRLAANLKEGYGLKQEPEVEVFSSFPPELLLGRIERIEVRVDLVRAGLPLRDLHISLHDIEVPVRSLWYGDLERQIPTGSLAAEVS